MLHAAFDMRPQHRAGRATSRRSAQSSSAACCSAATAPRNTTATIW
jgi:hypothetical protein